MNGRRHCNLSTNFLTFGHECARISRQSGLTWTLRLPVTAFWGFRTGRLMRCCGAAVPHAIFNDLCRLAGAWSKKWIADTSSGFLLFPTVDLLCLFTASVRRSCRILQAPPSSLAWTILENLSENAVAVLQCNHSLFNTCKHLRGPQEVHVGNWGSAASTGICLDAGTLEGVLLNCAVWTTRSKGA